MNQNKHGRQRVPFGDFPVERFEFQVLNDFRCTL